MDEDSIRIVQSGSEEEAWKILHGFSEQNLKAFTFPELNKDSKQRLMESILRRLASPGPSKLHKACLTTIRILSREKSGLDTVTSEAALRSFVQHAGLNCYHDGMDGAATVQDTSTNVMMEAQKCLCNIIFNSPVAQRTCSSNGCLEGIVQRMKTYKDPDLVHDIKFFDMRMLFLLTALCRDVRPRLRQDLHGFTYLIEVLDLTLREAEDQRLPLNDQDIELCCEVLKILFNITGSIDRNNLDEEEEAHFMRLVSVLHDLLVSKTNSKEKREELHNHTVNLLTNMPRESYEELLTPLTETAATEDAEAEESDVEYDGKNMEAIQVILGFLSRRLDVVNEPNASLKESLTPILLCMCEICRANSSIRKFCRIQVLPHMRDEVKRLPEEGTDIRNKVCKLFTNTVTEVKDLSADFIFVLCKESVTRFVKYTGYGNAAGLLAQRGLMCGGRGAGDYSSESEESETEEYTDLKDNINPVTGRWELPRSNPMEGMTDEQKEHEAMQLVNQLDKLQRAGVIQPTRVGDDGRPHSIDHILQLTDGINEPTPTRQDSESD